ncbi:MAG: metalloregulator ArsR/SmtB family transcription factor [Saccharospirillaceae bacterium]|nr:metalloregulator ArsR/SmtB family transcription factor [Saccharospirillaceae bacterium]MCD8532622.1 metalloregulator ArsR/SmtB family transcription factor [Saccharospirillaceae bacterium]
MIFRIFWLVCAVNPLTLFKCLNDETRLVMVLLLQQYGELCVCDLMAALEESQPKISRHLAQLRSAELLSSEKRGQWVYYRLHPQLAPWAVQIIATTLTANGDFITPYANRCRVLITDNPTSCC